MAIRWYPTCLRFPEYGYNGQIDDLYPKEVGVRMKPLKDGQLQQHYMVRCACSMPAAKHAVRLHDDPCWVLPFKGTAKAKAKRLSRGGRVRKHQCW